MTELERLKAKRDDLAERLFLIKQQLDKPLTVDRGVWSNGAYYAMRDRALAAEAKNKKLREIYDKYANHLPLCQIYDLMTDGGDSTQKCDCGFEQAFSEDQ